MDQHATFFLQNEALTEFLAARRTRDQLPNYREDIVGGIGRVVIAFQRLEKLLQILLLLRTGGDPCHASGRVIVEALSFGRLIYAIERIAKVEPTDSDLIKLCDAARKAEGIRNRVVHSVYFEDGRHTGNGTVMYDHNELVELANRIFALSSAASSLSTEHALKEAGVELPAKTQPVSGS